MAKTHYFPSDRVHFTWDTGNEPVLTVDSGDTVVVHTRDVSDDQIGPDSTADVIAGLDWDRVYPLAGPIAVDGARPATRSPSRSSTSTRRAGAGRRSCPASACCRTSSPTPTCGSSTSPRATSPTSATTRHPARAVPRDDGRLPGRRQQAAGDAARDVRRQHGHAAAVARDDALPARAGRRRAVQLRRRARRTGRRRGLRHRPRVADVRERCASRSRRAARSRAPQYRTAGPLTRASTHGGFYGTTGVGPDLYEGAQDAVRAMIEHLATSTACRREDAYLLCSLCVDLRISEIVDAGQYIVSALLPEAIFAG